MAPTGVLFSIASYVLPFLRVWWWTLAPIILWSGVKSLYLWWVRWEVWYRRNRWIVLKIKPPKEILKPFRAMEDLFSVLWGIYDSANWRERWCEGQLINGPFWASFEIVSIEGEIHFFCRIEEGQRNMVESAIYAHYPDVEISLVDDYVKNMPTDAPNKDWDLRGEDYTLLKANSYPIKTYEQFFEERPEVTKEEKRLDPLDSFLEEMAKLGPGEQFCFQMVIAPILDSDVPWITEGEELANKIARRPRKQKPKSFLSQTASEITEGLILGTKKSEAEKREAEKGLPKATKEEEKELLLSPEERATLNAVQKKIGKRGFKTWMRAVYLFKREADHQRHRMARSYMNHFATEGLNTIIYWGPTRCRIHYWFRKRRLFLRKRKILKNYIRRLPPLYPRMSGLVWWPWFPMPSSHKRRGWSVLNTEELATIYHFPAKISALSPALKPIEVKRGGPPPGLPTE